MKTQLQKSAKGHSEEIFGEKLTEESESLLFMF
jgi:hypothetical protein